MTAIVFRTPGSIDMRAFTIMGVNAKPNTDKPIGYFGTGLKYAVAVCCRLGASFEVHTSGHRYWFERAPLSFRGQDFEQIVMRRDTWVGGQGWRIGRPFEEGDEPDDPQLYVPREAMDELCECPAWTGTHEVIEGAFRVVKCAECGMVVPRDRDQVDF